ncbi:MAG: ferrous iron transport protein A [Spirochaetia bacterium]|nr:ferrous iron transport protein A [Spirochaetia bacterium]
MSTLDKVSIGASATVVSVLREDGVGLRLAEMGLIPGQRITVLRSAPFGDPIEISLLNYRLCLRRADASAVGVEIEI